MNEKIEILKGEQGSLKTLMKQEQTAGVVTYFNSMLEHYEAKIRPAPYVLEKSTYYSFQHFSKKIAYYSFLIPIQYLLFLYYSFLLQIIAGGQTLPTQNEAYACYHHHIYNHNNLSCLFIKVHQNHLKKHSQNLAINNCG